VFVSVLETSTMRKPRSKLGCCLSESERERERDREIERERQTD